MAETDPQDQSKKIEIEQEEERLKYLEFVQAATVYAVFYASTAYGYAKDSSGPLKPGVESVEGTVKTVVGPVYDKFHDVPSELLKFVDRKVDQSVNKLDSHVCPLVKQVSTRVASEVKSANVVETAKTAYTKYEPVAEQYAALAWRSLNQLPLFPRVAQVVVPTAAYCSDKYNETVKNTAEKGYKVSSYLPLVPTEKIAKVFSAEEAAAH